MIPLTCALGDIHPLALAVTQDRAAAHGLDLRIERFNPIHDAFSPMVRSQTWDISEMAIVSGIQAVAYGYPLRLLPVTLAARFQHKCIVRDRRRAAFGPQDLIGKRVGVRAYTQTTGAWVRAILQGEFGVHPKSITWVTQKGAHVPKYDEPTDVIRVDAGKSLLGMLETGEIDAAIFGNDLPDAPWLAPVIDAPQARAEASFEQSGIVAINHVLSVSKHALDRAGPDLIPRLMALMIEAKASLPKADPDLFPIGIDAMRPSLEALISTIFDQGLVPRRMTCEDLFITR